MKKSRIRFGGSFGKHKFTVTFMSGIEYEFETSRRIWAAVERMASFETTTNATQQASGAIYFQIDEMHR